MFNSTISEADNLLDSYIPKAGSYYELKRNFSIDLDTNKNTTSLLSPYIRYRILSEEKILKEVLNNHSYFESEKYIQEIFWRTYWKGWLEHRPEVYDDYLSDRDILLNKYYLKTKYPCIDELTATAPHLRLKAKRFHQYTSNQQPPRYRQLSRLNIKN